jgi:hypothetical protein
MAVEAFSISEQQKQILTKRHRELREKHLVVVFPGSVFLHGPTEENRTQQSAEHRLFSVLSVPLVVAWLSLLCFLRPATASLSAAVPAGRMPANEHGLPTPGSIAGAGGCGLNS